MPRWTLKASLFTLFAIYCIWMMINWDKWEGDEGTIPKLMAVLGAALFFGFLTVVYFIPMIGELTSTFFYSSGELIETDEDMRGAVLLAQGNYEGAIAEFRKRSQKDPGARFPVVEMAKIYVDNLRDPQAALDVLREALEREWEPDDAAFLLFRMADIQADSLADFEGARETLAIVTEQLPDTRHCANATHKLREIDDKEAAAQQRVARGESPIPQEEAPSVDPKEAARLQREKEEREFLEKLQGGRSGGNPEGGGGAS